MSRQKVTLNEIRRRKAEVLRQIRFVRTDVRNDVYRLTHPFESRGRRFSVGSLNSVANFVYKVRLAYKVTTTVVSFFRRRKH